MPNDLTTKQNVLNLRADARLDPRQHIDSKGFFPRGGGGGSLCLDAFGRGACGL